MRSPRKSPAGPMPPGRLALPGPPIRRSSCPMWPPRMRSSPRPPMRSSIIPGRPPGPPIMPGKPPRISPRMRGSMPPIPPRMPGPPLGSIIGPPLGGGISPITIPSFFASARIWAIVFGPVASRLGIHLPAHGSSLSAPTATAMTHVRLTQLHI